MQIRDAAHNSRNSLRFLGGGDIRDGMDSASMAKMPSEIVNRRSSRVRDRKPMPIFIFMRDRYSSVLFSVLTSRFEAYNSQLKTQMRLEIGHVFFSIDDDDDDGVFVVRKTNIHLASK